MRTYRFRIDPPILGFRSSVARAHDERYKGFKRAVRLQANLVGIPESLTPHQRATIYVKILWPRRMRIDTDNVLKATADSLWKSDRRISECHGISEENMGREEALVTVEIHDS